MIIGGIDDRYIRVYRENEHSYTCEMSCHSELDTEYTYPDLPSDKLQHIHLDTFFVFDMNQFLADGEQSYIWGSTENKFGLIDIKRKES